MKTEVVLKLPWYADSATFDAVFNENRGCIEIGIDKEFELHVPGLMKTEVVLKWSSTIWTRCSKYV